MTRIFPPSPIVRISVRPDTDDPAAVLVPRYGPRQPHTDATFATVRRLFEHTHLNYRQIAARTGVSTGSISNWSYDGGWKRPPFAPRSNDTVPAERARAKVRRRNLAARLDALAERHIRELEASAHVDPEKLAEAIELLKMVKLAARRRRKRRPGELAPEQASRPMGELCIADVDLSRAPREAVKDFVENRDRPPKDTLPPRGRGTRRQWRQWWMREGDK